MTFGLASLPLTVKNRGGMRLFGTVPLIGRIRYITLEEVYGGELSEGRMVQE